LLLATNKLLRRRLCIFTYLIYPSATVWKT